MRSRFPALVLITGLIAAACGGTATPGAVATTAAGTATAAASTAAPTPAPAKVSIMVGGLNKQIYLPNKLTEALGYFKDQNLTVTLIDEPSGKDSTTALIASEACTPLVASTACVTCRSAASAQSM